MITMNKLIKRGFLLSFSAMAAAALGSCASDDAKQMTAASDNTAVQVTAAVANSELALTRGADGLDTSSSGFSLLTAASSSSKINIRVDDGSGNYTNYAYSLTGATAISEPATPPYFPTGVNSVNVYGWYPENGGSTSFTVQSNQQSDENYCLSDVMIAQPTTSTRALSGTPEAWNVTPANLTFTHIMSKVKVTLNPATGVTVTGVVLKNAKKTVALATTGSPVVTAVTVGDASGDAGDITLLSGGSITSTSDAADKVLCGVFPPQSITGALLEITANYNDGDDQTITYSLEAVKTFATNKEYTIIIPLNPTNVETGTVTLSDWDAETGEINVETGGPAAPTLETYSVSIAVGAYEDVQPSVVGTAWAGISQDTSIATVETVEGKIRITGVSEGTTNVYIIPTAGVTGGFSSAVCEVTVVSITAMKPDALSSNPLWKVAQYNVAQNKTSFVSSHSTAFQYVFSWADANNNINIPGYHVPTWAEQVKIIPSTSATGGGTDWFDKAVSSTPAAMNSITGAGNTQEKGWYIKQSAKNNVYAVRIVDGVLTAWHYQWVTSPCHGVKIDSYVLAYQHTGAGDTWTDAEMQAILALLPSSSVWTTAAANESPESGFSTSSRCTRFLPACGYTDSTDGSGLAMQERGNYGYYWSATATPNYESNAFRWYFGSGNLLEYYYALGSGFSVRLFHDD